VTLILIAVHQSLLALIRLRYSLRYGRRQGRTNTIGGGPSRLTSNYALRLLLLLLTICLRLSG